MAVLLHSQHSDDLRLAEPIPLTRHPAGVYLNGLSGGSRRTIRYCLNTIAGMLTDQCCDALTLDWSKLRYHHTAAVQDYLRDNFAPVTANKMLSALRRVLREAHRLDLMAAEDYHKAVDLPNRPAHASQPRGRCLSGGEIAALMDTCNSDCPLDVRDAAIMAVLRGTGMRRAELVKLELRDWHRGRGELLVRLSNTILL